MAEHLLHLIEVTEEGYAHWDFECTHPTLPAEIPVEWQGIDSAPEDGCWFHSWWAAVGQELIGHLRIPRDPTLPLAVRPSDDWNFDLAGTIVLDVPNPQASESEGS